MSVKIEVTLVSLCGILASDGTHDSSEVTVTVNFSGSASNMEVCSSTLCSITGKLIVESTPVDITGETPHTAHWHPPGKLPHLTCHLSAKSQKIKKAPLARSNRDSKVIKEIPALQEMETQSTVSITTASSASSKGSPTRNSSAVWSNSGAAMPEIIELETRIRHGLPDSGSETTAHGVSFLVLFGHDEQGTYTMDLPVRQLQRQPRRSLVDLSPHARLRVKVRVTPVEEVASMDMESSQSTNSQSAEPMALHSLSMLEEQIVPLIEQIRLNEKRAIEYKEVQKRAMEVFIPVKSSKDNDADVPAEDSLFCNGLWNWNRLIRTLASAIEQCDASLNKATPENFIYSDSSTIATRDSLDI